MTYAATMRVTPVMRGKVQGLTAHNARSEEYAKKTSHIAPDRVKDNLVIFGTSDPSIDLLEAIDGIPPACKTSKESEQYVGAELILTASAEYFASLTPDDFAAWQNRNLAWLQAEFDQAGRGRLVNAILHMDEKAPHIHAVIAPVVEKSRIHPVTKQPMAPKPQINYSAIFGDRPEVLAKARKDGRSHLDTQLGRLQTSYAAAMAPCGLVRGRESMRTKAPDVQHVAPHIYRQIQGQITALENQIGSYKQHTCEWEKYFEDLKSGCDNLRKQYYLGTDAIEKLKEQYKDEIDKLEELKEERKKCEKEIDLITSRSVVLKKVYDEMQKIDSETYDDYEEIPTQETSHEQSPQPR